MRSNSIIVAYRPVFVAVAVIESSSGIFNEVIFRVSQDKPANEQVLSGCFAVLSSA